MTQTADRSPRSEDPALGLDIAEPAPLPQVEWWTVPVEQGGANDDGYGEMVARLRRFLNTVTAARPDSATLAALTADLAGWDERLAPTAVSERNQFFGRRPDLPGRGQTMSPVFVITEADRNTVRGTVTFGRYFLGGNGAVHGGAIPLFFDEVLGRLSVTAGRTRARTAYLHTDFRSITPVGIELDVHAWFVSEEGRKRELRAELRHADVLCAEAEGLFVALKPGQP